MKKIISMFLATTLCVLICSCAKVQPSAETLEQRVYTALQSDELPPASLTLSEGNRFQFVFSAVSSYIGIGSYRVDGDKVLLTTDDGAFYYTFIITDAGLVFDAVNSSENLWFGSFTDGSVFQ